MQNIIIGTTKLNARHNYSFDHNLFYHNKTLQNIKMVLTAEKEKDKFNSQSKDKKVQTGNDQEKAQPG